MKPRHLAFVAAMCITLPAAADFTADLNGHLAGSLRYFKSDFEKGEDRFEGEDNGSNLAVLAAYKQEAWRLFARYERGIKNDKFGTEANRQLMGGIETPYGQITGGKMVSEYRELGQRVDPFYDTSVVGFNGRVNREGASYGHSNLVNGFSRNAVSIKTPLLFDRFQLNVGGFFNDKNPNNSGTDYSAGALFTTPLKEGMQYTAAVQYLKIKNAGSFGAGNPARNELLAVAGSPGKSSSVEAIVALTTATVSLGASYENVDVEAESRPRHYASVSGSYALSETNRLAATVGYLDFGGGSPAIDGVGYSLGVFHKIGDSSSFYLAGHHSQLNGTGASDVIAMGLAVNFGIKLFPISFGGGE